MALGITVAANDDALVGAVLGPVTFLLTVTADLWRAVRAVAREVTH